jgi:DNA-binding CsgD family transcriptional regulator
VDYADPKAVAVYHALLPVQQDVVMVLAVDLTPAQIARYHHMSGATVYNHIGLMERRFRKVATSGLAPWRVRCSRKWATGTLEPRYTARKSTVRSDECCGS